MTASEPVRAGVCRDFIRRFGPCGLNPDSFFSAYGLAEFTLAVSNYGRTTRSFDAVALRRHRVRPATHGPSEEANGTALVSCGRVLGDTEVKIVDVTAAPRGASDGEVGEIWIRGSSKCLGYWQRPELSAEVFEARLPGDLEGAPTWLRTGDMGFLHEGELYHCGRVKDMLIVRGLNYYPQDIEAVFEEDERVRKGCVAAFALEQGGRETLVVVAELKDPRRMADARSLNQRLVQGLGVSGGTFVFIAPRSIPKTSSGKIARHLVRERWLDRRLDVLAQVDVDSDAGQPSADGARAWLARGTRGLS
jgi:acyl-CoA synthetase (AMP-forming)/AMP-acid ligase II